MPTLTIKTNIKKDAIPGDFLQSTARIIADLLSKPISYVVVHIEPEQMMMWAGVEGPCAIASLGSIGSLGKSQNAKISNSLSAHVEKSIGVKPDKMYIGFKI